MKAVKAFKNYMNGIPLSEIMGPSSIKEATVLHKIVDIPGVGRDCVAATPIFSGEVIVEDRACHVVPKIFAHEYWGDRYMEHNQKPFHLSLDAILNSFQNNDIANIIKDFTFSQTADAIVIQEANKAVEFLIAKKATDPRNKKILVKYILTLLTNAHMNPPSEGVAFYKMGAIFNHSCEPNASHNVNEEGTYLLRSLAQIEQDKTIAVSYIPEDDLVLAPYTWRKETIKQTRLFDCQCPRCLRESDSVSVPLESTDPRRCEDKGQVLELLRDLPFELRGLAYYQILKDCQANFGGVRDLDEWLDAYHNLEDWVRGKYPLALDEPWLNCFLARQTPVLLRRLIQCERWETADKIKKEMLPWVHLEFGEVYL